MYLEDSTHVPGGWQHAEGWPGHSAWKCAQSGGGRVAGRRPLPLHTTQITRTTIQGACTTDKNTFPLLMDTSLVKKTIHLNLVSQYQWTGILSTDGHFLSSFSKRLSILSLTYQHLLGQPTLTIPQPHSSPAPHEMPSRLPYCSQDHGLLKLSALLPVCTPASLSPH